MHLHSLTFPAGGRCQLAYEKTYGWLRATWTGHIGPQEAFHGGLNYLQQAGPLHCRYLLNDNSALRGPWFDSLEWLGHVWLPKAQQVGLRYVAHIVQADTHVDILSRQPLPLPTGEIDLQLFDAVPDAEVWLRSCQGPVPRGRDRLPGQARATGPRQRP